jgi:hypothetical protein
MSRAKWYRQRTMRRETDSSAPSFILADDEVVSGTSKKREFERPSAAKGRGHPSSQTATSMVADKYKPSPRPAAALRAPEASWSRAGNRAI